MVCSSLNMYMLCACVLCGLQEVALFAYTYDYKFIVFCSADLIYLLQCIVYLHVTILLFVTEPPEILANSNDTDVIIGSSVTVFCVARGIYLPTVTWRRGQDVLSNSSTLTISETSEANSVINSSLMISVFTRSDAGQYSCDVTNEAGNDTASFELVTLGITRLLLT